MIETEAVERKRTRGGFLNLFDWPGKSRKKLFSSELSEASKQEKQNAQNPSKSRPSPIGVNETGQSSTYNPRSDSSCSTSTVTSDDGQESRAAPSVVARLMGLESLPVPNSLEPRSNPDFHPSFLRSSRKIGVNETGQSSTYNPRSDSSCSTSTVTSDDGQESRAAPSVVARLMGLESLPVPNSLEPRSNPDFHPSFLRSSRKASTWDAYESLGYVNLRTDYDGISWDHLNSSQPWLRPRRCKNTVSSRQNAEDRSY